MHLYCVSSKGRQLSAEPYTKIGHKRIAHLHEEDLGLSNQVKTEPVKV